MGSVVGDLVVLLFVVVLLLLGTAMVFLDWSYVLVMLGLVLALYVCIIVQLF